MSDINCPPLPRNRSIFRPHISAAQWDDINDKCCGEECELQYFSAPDLAILLPAPLRWPLRCFSLQLPAPLPVICLVVPPLLVAMCSPAKAVSHTWPSLQPSASLHKAACAAPSWKEAAFAKMPLFSMSAAQEVSSCTAAHLRPASAAPGLSGASTLLHALVCLKNFAYKYAPP